VSDPAGASTVTPSTAFVAPNDFARPSRVTDVMRADDTRADAGNRADSIARMASRDGAGRDGRDRGPQPGKSRSPGGDDAPRADAPTDPRLLRTQRICRERAFRERDTSIRRLVGDIGRQARRDMERAGAVAEAWTAAMPAEIVAETWIEQAGGAQLVVGVSSSAVAYAVDRALRMGALAEIRLRLKSPGLRVRTRVGRSPDQEPAPGDR
jgi:hypothetical protein